MSLGVTYYDQNFNNVNNAAYDTRYVVKSRKSITNVQRHTLRLTFSAICDWLESACITWETRFHTEPTVVIYTFDAIAAPCLFV